MTLLESLERVFTVEPRRLERARNLCAAGVVTITGEDQGELVAEVGPYIVTVARDGTKVSCTCPDWTTRGEKQAMACKHILAVALCADGPAAPRPAPQPEASPEESFRQRVRRAVGQAIEDLADRVDRVLAAGETPLLIGPTGCGKTSAVRLVAARRGWGFEEVAGAPSFADADLVGVRMPGGVAVPGVFARAFERARAGETVLLFLDELTRFNARAQDLLMRPILPVEPAVAAAMGLPAEGSVRIVEAPLWGVEWAPAAQVHLALACNPWGAALDPALLRRARPIEVAFAEPVAEVFDPDLRDVILASWKATAEGELPLPIEYQALVSATGPGDASVLQGYLARLAAFDRAAAEGFRRIAAGLGVAV